MRTQRPAIPVLMYHHVNPEGSFINVRPETFERHLRYLRAHGYTPLHAGEFSDILTGKAAAPRRPVMITFDDGWLDNWVFAFPLLRRYGMKAVIFLITAQIAGQGRRQRSDEGSAAALPSHKESKALVAQGRAGEVMLSWDEVMAMKDSGLIEFHSHTHTHQRWDKLLAGRGERNESLRKDLSAAKELLEKKGLHGGALCWPQGFYDNEYLAIAGSLGYRMMFTTEAGANGPDADLKRVRRIVIGDISTFSLAKKLFIYSRPMLAGVYLRYFK